MIALHTTLTHPYHFVYIYGFVELSMFILANHKQEYGYHSYMCMYFVYIYGFVELSMLILANHKEEYGYHSYRCMYNIYDTS